MTMCDIQQEAWSAIDFGHKPSLWRKTIRSVILRMRGQEQHKVSSLVSIVSIDQPVHTLVFVLSI